MWDLGYDITLPKTTRTHHHFTSIRKGKDFWLLYGDFQVLHHLPKNLRQTWLNIDLRHDPSVVFLTKLPPTKNLKWNLKMMVSKFGISSSQGSEFSFHVSFRGCMGILYPYPWKMEATSWTKPRSELDLQDFMRPCDAFCSEELR